MFSEIGALKKPPNAPDHNLALPEGRKIRPKDILQILQAGTSTPKTVRPTSVGQLPEPLHSLSSTAATTCPVCVLGGWLQLYLAQSDQNQAHQSGFLYLGS